MNEENSPWQYKPDDGSSTPGSESPGDEDAPDPKRESAKSVAWEAAEFIEHPHSAGWYLALVVSISGLAALVYLLSKDIIAVITIVIVGIIVGVFAGQKPSRAKYQITETGLSVNGKLYRYSSYKSFTVVSEGTLSSANLFPLKRFMPPLSVYFEPGDEPKIINALGNFLPYEERKLDGVDRLARRLRL